MSTVKITTALGAELTFNFSTKMVKLPSGVTEKFSAERAFIAHKLHAEHPEWPSSGTYYISLGANIIALARDQADIFNAAAKDYRVREIIAENAALDAAVPGLRILQKAISDLVNYQYLFNKAMEDEHNDGVDMPAYPSSDVDALSRQYPVAALYIKADAYTDAGHHLKSAAGDKAKKMLVEGCDLAVAEAVLDNWLPASAVWD
ncbi:MAG: hypothetical protein COB61_004185 [Thiotrichales bacterium]|nr:hypothetical protein [Thiotrichales bacterium]